MAPGFLGGGAPTTWVSQETGSASGGERNPGARGASSSLGWWFGLVGTGFKWEVPLPNQQTTNPSTNERGAAAGSFGGGYQFDCGVVYDDEYDNDSKGTGVGYYVC